MIINSRNIAALTQSFKASFNQAAAASDTVWDKIATKIPSTTSSNVYAWLGQAPAMREWIGDRHIKSFKAHDYTLVNKSYESTVSVSRDAIEDDQYGIFSNMMADLAIAANAHVDEMVMGALANGVNAKSYDGQAFFDTDHPVGNDTIATVSNHGGGAGEPWVLLDTSRSLKPLIYQERKPNAFQSFTSMDDEYVFLRKEFLYGVDCRANVGYAFWQQAYYSRQTLNEANFNAARLALMSFKSDEGRYLGIKPTLLIVNPANLAAATSLLTAQTLPNGASNTLYNATSLLVSPYLVTV